MISELSRFVYVGQAHIFTFRNYFPNQVPTAGKLFSELLSAEVKNPTVTKKLEMEISFQKIDVSAGYVTILFKVVDPSIPDHVVVDLKNGKHRTNLRGANEAPIICAHLVINADEKYEKTGIYPAVLENNDFLPRSYMIEHINAALTRHFTKPRAVPSKDGKKIATKDFSPRINFGASLQATVKGVLTSGGKLKGVKWVEQTFENSTAGDGAYPQTERHDVYMNVGNRPTGAVAESILQQIAAKIPFSKAKKVSVILEDSYGKPKVVGLSSNSQDVLGAIFIPQEQVHLPLDRPLKLFESTIHFDFAKRLKALAK